MIQIDDKIISEDVFAENFVCNLSKCKGICCVDGDAGAPLDQMKQKFLQKSTLKLKTTYAPKVLKL